MGINFTDEAQIATDVVNDVLGSLDVVDAGACTKISRKKSLVNQTIFKEQRQIRKSLRKSLRENLVMYLNVSFTHIYLMFEVHL